MERDIQRSLDNQIKKQRRRRVWKRILSVLGSIVVFCTTYALILPAITMSETSYCGKEEHLHDNECYVSQLICEIENAEIESHVHQTECYIKEQVLICTLEETKEHVHTEECLGEEPEVYICEPEIEGHIHATECWSEVETLICELPTTKVIDVEVHEHTEACYEKQINCEKEEHSHSLICFSNKNADIETATEWEASLPDELTGVWADDLITVAESQLGYTESTNNYEVSESGDMKGYTRYGDWYGDRYGHWCAMYVSFCLHYAGISEEAFPQEANCQKWIETLSDEMYGLYYPSDDPEYEVCSGDLIFFNNDSDENSDHVGIVVEVSEEDNYIKTIEGNSSEQVKYNEYELDDTSIMGYGMLPMNPEEFGGATTLEATYSTDFAEYITSASMGDIVYNNQRCNTLATLNFHVSSEVLTRQRTFTYQIPSNYLIDQNVVNNTNNNKPVVTNSSGTKLFRYYYSSSSTVTIEFLVTESVTNSIVLDGYIDKSNIGDAILFADGVSASARLSGKVNNTTLTYNEMENAFTKNPAYEKYYNEDSPLGIAGSFHIVAFDTATLSSHTNGNILARKLYAGSNFGTNNYANELSYIVDYCKANSTSASKAEHILVVGSETGLTIHNDKYAIVGDAETTHLDSPNNLVKDVNSVETPFINLAKLEIEINGVSNKLKNKTANITVDTTSNSQAGIVRLDKPDDIVYCNITPSKLSTMNGSELHLEGFQSGHDGSIIMNVDCSNAPTNENGVKVVNMPKAYVYVDGQKQNVSEVIVFTAGKVIWNFYNAEGVEINTTEMTGMVIAPGATININSNLNGTVVAQNINVKAESHRTDFTGDIDETEDTELYPYLALFKVDENNVSVHLTGAKFKIEKWNATEKAYVLVSNNVEVDSNGGMLILDKNPDGTNKELTFNTAYRLTEVTAPLGYKLSSVPREFYVPHTDTNKYPLQLPAYKINTYESGHIFYFKNEAINEEEEMIPIRVEKKWYDANGNEASAGLEEITFAIWRDVYTENPGKGIVVASDYSEGANGLHMPISTEQYRSGIELNKASWVIEITDLPKCGKMNINGVETKVYYTYYVVENPVEDYDASYEMAGSTIIIKNTSTREENYVLPETGSIGTNMFTIGGAAFMAVGLLGGCLVKRKRERRVN